ncbi:hypothetical protein C8R47DRAFT_69020 [Mycena vitilis]|nr:hypothetical protein C8R47DRAFT_69020 [Mycena vitilis]
MFSNCADFQVHNGTFYAVQGDINVHQRSVADSTLQIESRNETSRRAIFGANPRLQIGGRTTREEWDDVGTNVQDRNGASHTSDASQSRPPPRSRSVNSGLNSAIQTGSMPFGSRPFPAQGSLNFSETGGGGTYITAGNVNHFHPRGDSGVGILHRSIALEAIHDSAESFPQPRCHPETRTKMLGDLWQWATDASASEVLWLYGPAGSGKSAVMQTLCQRLEDASLLGGSFFFRRGHPTRGNARVLFATLAYQLALHNPTLKPLISEKVEQHPAIVGKSMASQLRRLIVDPCRSVTNLVPQILLIDGLDECEGVTTTQEILRSIRRAFCARSLPLRIMVASRPEPEIREIFEESAYQGRYATINIDQSFHDIRKYLRHEFRRIRREHEAMRAIPEPWPHPAVVEELVHRSSGYFIYAATAIRFVDDRDFRPAERLEELRRPALRFNSPFAHLDQMYTQILSTVPVSVRPRLLSILCAIMHFNNAKAVELEELLQLRDGDIQLTCRRLSSLLQVVPRLAVHHASFLDFLADSARSGEFYVGFQHKLNLARSVLKTLSHAPDDAMSECRKEMIFNGNFASKGTRYVTSAIPPYWGGDLVPLFRNLDVEFFRQDPKWILCAERIIRWLEAVNPTPQDAINAWQEHHDSWNKTKSEKQRGPYLKDLWRAGWA